MNNINYENFDYEAYFQEIKNDVQKHNILVCGAAGAEKTSLLHDILEIEENEPVLAKSEEQPETEGIVLYSSISPTANFYDSIGYKVDDKKRVYYRKIIRFIDKQRKKYPGQIEKHIHEVWYRISAENKDCFKFDEGLVKAIAKRNLPVIIIVTKQDGTDELELKSFMEEIDRKMPYVKCCICSFALFSEEDRIGEYVPKTQIIEWAAEHLDESLRREVILVIREEIQEKRRNIIKNYIPKYSGIAAASVAGTAVIPIPFSDSVFLMAIQVKMAKSIIQEYGIQADMGEIITDIVGTSIISYIGKTFASQIISVIPAVGRIVTGAVNISVAVTVTAVLGAAIAVVAEQYLIACVKKGGADHINFTEFFTKERIMTAIRYVKEHKNEFNLDHIIAAIKNKYTKSADT